MSLTHDDIAAFWVTVRLALLTTAILLLIGIPLAWWLARSRWRWRFLIDAVIALPLVLPPTVLGFYLLIAMGPNGPIGRLGQAVDLPSLAFTFPGLVIGSLCYSLPFVINPLRNAFEAIGPRPLEVAATLRAAPLDRFFSVVLPLAKPGLITATVLGFAHTVGEFGVVLMIGGNIPGSTQVLSIAIYDHVEALEYGQAHLLSGGLLVVSFILLAVVYALNGRLSILNR